MKKCMIIFWLTCFIFVGYIAPVLAIDCEYDDVGLVLTYDENLTNINSDFIKSEWYVNFIWLVEVGRDIDATDKINLDQTLYQKYQGYTCPTAMKVCTEVEYAINMPTLLDAGKALLLVGALAVNGISGLIVSGGVISEDTINGLYDSQYALITADKRTLYIYTEEEFKKSDIQEGLVISNTARDHFLASFDYLCGDDGCSFSVWSILKFLASAGWSNIQMVKEIILGEIKAIYGKHTVCDEVFYTGEYSSADINCTSVAYSLFKYSDKITEYKGCTDDECKLGVRTDITQLEKQLKVHCDYVLRNYLYSNLQKGCIEDCLNLTNTLNEKKADTDLYVHKLHEGSNGCFLSARVVNWVLKVIQWIRYIVPVLLILLSVLDFIKAIASDSDDEIKKVGGRFAKRLLAAAAIFIVPLFLEFILNMFGLLGPSGFCL